MQTKQTAKIRFDMTNQKRIKHKKIKFLLNLK